MCCIEIVEVLTVILACFVEILEVLTMLLFVAYTWADPLRVQIIKAHHNWIVVAYAHFFVCYR